MPDAMKALGNKLVIWRLAIWRLFVHCFVISGGMYLASMGNTHWADLDGDSRFKLELGIAMTVAGTISAFLDQTMNNLASGRMLPPGVEEKETIDVDATVHTTTVTTTQPQEVK